MIPGLGLHLPSDWDTATLDEVTSKIGSGATPRGGASVYVDSGPVLIRSQNVHDHDFKTAGLVCLSPEAAASLRGVTVEPGDVLINITGDSILRTALVPDSVLPARVNQHVAIVRSNGTVDPLFLQKWLCLPLMKDYMLGHSSGGTRKAITKGHLQSFPIPLPPIEEQRAIAATLGALDDKIESNRRAIAKLDELFHAMWRREYDGVPVETEAPLSEHVTTQYGLTASASSDADGDKFLRVTDINKQNWIDWTGVPFAPTDDSSRAKYTLSKGDLLVARMADPGKSAIYDGGPTAVFASYLVRLKPSSYEEALFIYGFLKSSEYLDYATGAMTGSVQKNMNAKVIVAASLRWPDSSALSRFAEHAVPLRNKIAQIVEESARLSALRDALLPELLSGRIRTGDLEVAS